MHIDSVILEVNIFGSGKKEKIAITFCIFFYLLSFICKYLIPKIMLEKTGMKLTKWCLKMHF